MRWVMQFILGVRRIKGEMNISPGKAPARPATERSDCRMRLAGRQPALPGFPRPTESVTLLGMDEQAPESAIAWWER